MMLFDHYVRVQLWVLCVAWHRLCGVSDLISPSMGKCHQMPSAITKVIARSRWVWCSGIGWIMSGSLCREVTD